MKIAKVAPYVEYQTFNYSKDPCFFGVYHTSGKYAWKPVIIEEVVLEASSSSEAFNSLFVFWLGTGVIIQTRLFRNNLNWAHSHAIYSPPPTEYLKIWI